jgi:hypothetical protein
MPVQPPRIPIVVLAGQSNANSTQLSVEAYRHVAQNGGMLVHHAVNGSALSARVETDGGHWNAGSTAVPMGNNLAALLYNLRAILDPASPSHVPGAYLESIIWVQGEADAFSRTAAATYAANLQAMHDALSERFGAHDMVISGLSDAPHRFRLFNGDHATHWNTIQAQQHSYAAQEANVVLVNPDQVAAGARISAADMFRSDFIHYDDTTGFSGHLGRRLAEAALPDGNDPAAARASSALPVFAGTSGADNFAVVLGGFCQVMGGAGYDSVTVSSTNASLTFIETSVTSSRIVEGSGPARRIIDLIGIEKVTLSQGNDSVQLGGGVKVIYSGAGNDRATGFATAEFFDMGTGDDYAFGARGRDTLRGGYGDDRLWGGDDHDTLYGSPGNDTLWGGQGNDVLVGGQGNDVLLGESGADRFVFKAGSGHDRITDFDVRTDMLQFIGLQPRDVTIRQSGADLLISSDFGSLRLTGVSAGDLGVHDILFV